MFSSLTGGANEPATDDSQPSSEQLHDNSGDEPKPQSPRDHDNSAAIRWLFREPGEGFDENDGAINQNGGAPTLDPVPEDKHPSNSTTSLTASVRGNDVVSHRLSHKPSGSSTATGPPSARPWNNTAAKGPGTASSSHQSMVPTSVTADSPYSGHVPTPPELHDSLASRMASSGQGTHTSQEGLVSSTDAIELRASDPAVQPGAWEEHISPIRVQPSHPRLRDMASDCKSPQSPPRILQRPRSTTLDASDMPSSQGQRSELDLDYTTYWVELTEGARDLAKTFSSPWARKYGSKRRSSSIGRGDSFISSPSLSLVGHRRRTFNSAATTNGRLHKSPGEKSRRLSPLKPRKHPD